jgi:8-oxo-dGTP pyrophosphatase MutT (NUDIX family)
VTDPIPAARAERAIADALEQTRERTARDGTDPAVPVAGTVVLLRDGAGGPEVLMIERPDRGSFAGAWVFPGGKLEPADRRDDADEEGDARRAGVRETWEETGLTLDGTALQTLSCWDPPPGLPLRIRTWFFVGRAPHAAVTLAADEAVSSTWIRPEDALARHGRGQITLYPPTWVTLHGLTGADDVDALLDVVRFGRSRRFETIVRRTPAGAMFLWQDDVAYADATLEAASGPRHRLETWALPWVYLRAD